MSHAGRRRGRDGDSTARPCHVKVVGEERGREEALGLLITKEDPAGQNGVRAGAVLLSPRATAWPLCQELGGWQGRDRAARLRAGRAVLLVGLWAVAALPSALSCSGRDAAPGGPYPGWSLGSLRAAAGSR